MQQNLYKIFYGICILLSFLLIYFAANNKINLFYSPEEILSNNNLIGKEIKIGGIVKTNSIVHYNNLNISFIITDYRHEITVNYTGVLPDLFRDHQGVVITGILTDTHTLNARKIFAKHDEKYISNEFAHQIN